MPFITRRWQCFTQSFCNLLAFYVISMWICFSLWLKLDFQSPQVHFRAQTQSFLFNSCFTVKLTNVCPPCPGVCTSTETVRRQSLDGKKKNLYFFHTLWTNTNVTQWIPVFLASVSFTVWLLYDWRSWRLVMVGGAGPTTELETILRWILL